MVKSRASDGGAGSQTFRSGWHWWGWLVGGVILTAFGVVFIVTLFTIHHQIPLRVVLAVVFLVAAGVCVYCSRFSVMIDRSAGTVSVRNPLQKLSVPITDIDGFEAWAQLSYRRQGPPGQSTYGVHGPTRVQLRLRSGAAVFCRGLSTTRYGDTVQLARRLNQAAGLGLLPVVPAAKVPDEDQGRALLAVSLGRPGAALTQVEEKLFVAEHQLWLKRQSQAQ